MTNEHKEVLVQVDIGNASHVEHLKRLVWEYFVWGNTISRNTYGFDYDIESMMSSFLDSLEDYLPPRGRLYLLRCDSRFIGTGGYKPVSTQICELKRLYIQEQCRGKKIGLHLLQRLINDARVAGYQRMRLESARFMRQARALYKQNGFSEIPLYGSIESPSAYHSMIYCMERNLRT